MHTPLVLNVAHWYKVLINIFICQQATIFFAADENIQKLITDAIEKVNMKVRVWLQILMKLDEQFFMSDNF